jgi:hypothetical protein
MGVPRTFTGILAGALAAPLLVTACGGDDSIADPPISSAPTSSPTRSPEPETPEQFIQRFAEVERAMENTGEISDYQKLTESCSPCADLARQIQHFYRAGGYVHWAGWSIKGIRPYDSASRRNSYAVHVVSAPTTYRESSRAPIKHLDGGPATEIVSIKRLDDSWVVTGRAKLSS